MSLSLNFPNVFNLVLLSLQNSFVTSVRLCSSRGSLYVFKITQWLSWLCFIVVRRYVLILLRVEQENNIFGWSKSQYIDQNYDFGEQNFCGWVNLWSRLMMNGMSVLVLRSSRNVLSNNIYVFKLFLLWLSP